MTVVPDEAFIFNIVWTGTVFDALHWFVASQIRHSGARFRFVANGCPPEQVERLESFAEGRPDRVVEVLDVAPDVMVAHGVALDRVREIRDDGPYFCFIDPDIKAGAPFVGHFAAILDDAVGVTSGREVWTEENVVPDGYLGVGGRHFYNSSGFVFGSPHLAMYRSEALAATTERWGVGLGSGGPELSDEAKSVLHEMGHDYLLYDTGKLVNIFLQVDGGRLVHTELDQLVHVGGLSHFMAPSEYVDDGEGNLVPDWSEMAEVRPRYLVAGYAAEVMRAVEDGRNAPPLPETDDPGMRRRYELVLSELSEMVREGVAEGLGPLEANRSGGVVDG